MSRLIDADKLIECASDYFGSHMINLVTATEIVKCLIKDIENQPTAYDIDKVVGQLEDRKKQLSNDLAKDYYGIREYEHRSDEIEKISDIVMAGGME